MIPEGFLEVSVEQTPLSPELSLTPVAPPHTRPWVTAGSWERRPDSGISDFLSSSASSIMGPLHVCPPEKWERFWERMMSVSVSF